MATSTLRPSDARSVSISLGDAGETGSVVCRTGRTCGVPAAAGVLRVLRDEFPSARAGAVPPDVQTPCSTVRMAHLGALRGRRRPPGRLLLVLALAACTVIGGLVSDEGVECFLYQRAHAQGWNPLMEAVGLPPPPPPVLPC